MNTYLIVSETIYKTKEILKELTKDIANIITFNMQENSINEILEEASYFSMFNDKKCIIVKNAKIFSSEKSNKEDLEKLEKYLDNENKNTILIFIYNGKCDSKRKVYNKIKSAGNLYIVNNMTRTDIKNELLKYVNSKKYKIDDKSLWYIINNTLGNYDISINELDKIMMYYSKPSQINYNDVINLTSKLIIDNNFKLIDSIISKDLENSIYLLEDLKILKIEPSIIISLLYRKFKLMLSIIIYKELKYSKEDILKNLKLAEWQYNKVYDNLNKYNKKEIKNEIIKLSNIDYQYKSGLLNRDIVLIKFIVELCI